MTNRILIRICYLFFTIILSIIIKMDFAYLIIGKSCCKNVGFRLIPEVTGGVWYMFVFFYINKKPSWNSNFKSKRIEKGKTIRKFSIINIGNTIIN